LQPSHFEFLSAGDMEGRNYRELPRVIGTCGSNRKGFCESTSNLRVKKARGAKYDCLSTQR